MALVTKKYLEYNTTVIIKPHSKFELDPIKNCLSRFWYIVVVLKLGQAYIFAPVDYFDLVFADYNQAQLTIYTRCY